MKFYSIDQESHSMSEIDELKTLALISRMMGTAIGRWLLSGFDLPDMNATDGVSEAEAAMEFE